ncbi:hypothetical protein [Marinicella rhabdoformis]|uniref:hypothetical protein n=1 Tax=Marinicella rhabdoformis TaxID=2580566 RepID=UPI0012AED743|nr:hypothetical protein [Marinicella rhabdoformis]
MGVLPEDLAQMILLGYETKSKYTFGDLKEVFIPSVKGSKLKLYRLGPEYEIIEI